VCGICGILNYSGEPVSQASLNRMNDSMVLRGPDDSGTYLKGHFGMAMRRLSIVDLSGGHQPISNEDGNIHLVLNGEIYNAIELRYKLKKLGHQFRTSSDVEVLIHLYEEYEFKAIEYLNGMFAFALWDERKQRLWLGRDRLGIKPLVYCSNKDSFSFASTLDALIEQKGFAREVDEDSLLLFLTLSYVPTPRSIWKDIHKLPPSHWMLIENGNMTMHRYWSIEHCNKPITSEEFLEEVESLLTDSIKLHSRSDVDVGTFLSGGVDSSAVTALFSKQTSYSVKTFSMDFDGKEENEGNFAKIVADRYQTKHCAYSLTTGKAVETLDYLFNVMDEPMADSAIVPSYLLSNMAQKSGLKVMLSGAGGDELFGGYYRHYRSKHDRLAGSFNWLQSVMHKNITNLLPLGVQQYAFTATNSVGFSHGISTSGINLGVLNQLLANSKLSSDTFDLLNEQLDELPELERIWGFSYSRMLLDIKHYLVDNVLAITDKTSMATSIEARVPLLDHRLVELLFSVRPEINLSYSFTESKRTLKSVVKKDLHDSILSRSKMGFNGPVEMWVNEIVKRVGSAGMVNVLSSTILGDFIDRNKLDRLVSQPNKFCQTSENIFNIYVLGQWLEKNT